MSEASIIFRNKDLTGSRKIYVDSLEGAATLAAKYRRASYYVDVISNFDQVALRWEQGAPDWKLGDVLPLSLTETEYQFERSEDQFWDPQHRANLLFEGLSCAFDAATSHSNPVGIDRLTHKMSARNLDVWSIVEEGREVGLRLENETSPDAWAKKICDWMADSRSLYVSGVVEQVALWIKHPQLYCLNGITTLDAKLADRHALRLMEAGKL